MPLILNGTTGVSGVDGTASTPAIKGSDTDTGIVYGTNTVQIATNGATAVTVDSNRRLGVGTTTPAGVFTAVSTSDQAVVGLFSGASYAVRLGTIASVGASIEGVDVTGSASYQPLNMGGSLFAFSISGAEKARIDNSGNLLVGTADAGGSTGAGHKIIQGSTPAYYMVGAASTNSSNSYHLYSTGAAAFRFYVGYGGTVFATNTTISAISDIRLKENIQDIDAGLDAIKQLKPRKFDWKDGKGKDIKGDRGFIAQEFAQVFPELIDEWIDPAPQGEEPYKSVRQDLVPVLVKAIQELSAKLDAAEARIAALEAK